MFFGLFRFPSCSYRQCEFLRHFTSRSSISRKKYEQHCQVLELPPGASKEALKQQYYKLSMKYHPDVNPSSEANSKFLSISNAYSILRHLPDIPLGPKIPVPPSSSFKPPNPNASPHTYHPGRIPFDFKLHQYEHYDKHESKVKRRPMGMHAHSPFTPPPPFNTEHEWKPTNLSHGSEWILIMGWFLILTLPLIVYFSKS